MKKLTNAIKTVEQEIDQVAYSNLKEYAFTVELAIECDVKLSKQYIKDDGLDELIGDLQGYENVIWEAGYIRGLNEALKIMKKEKEAKEC